MTTERKYGDCPECGHPYAPFSAKKVLCMKNGCKCDCDTAVRCAEGRAEIERGEFTLVRTQPRVAPATDGKNE